MTKRTPKKLLGVCYWCGAPPEGREHVIPRCFFPPGSKEGRIVVPSCQEHNGGLGPVDEHMRFIIQACADALSQEALRGVRRIGLDSIIHASRTVSLDGNPGSALQVSSVTVKKFMGKIARGIFYSHENNPFPGVIGFTASHMLGPKNRDQEIESATSILTSTKPGTNVSAFSKGKVTDDSVFKYRYALVTEENFVGFVLHGTFYKAFDFLALGSPKKPVPKA